MFYSSLMSEDARGGGSPQACGGTTCQGRPTTVTIQPDDNGFPENGPTMDAWPGPPKIVHRVLADLQAAPASDAAPEPAAESPPDNSEPVAPAPPPNTIRLPGTTAPKVDPPPEARPQDAQPLPVPAGAGSRNWLAIGVFSLVLFNAALVVFLAVLLQQDRAIHLPEPPIATPTAPTQEPGAPPPPATPTRALHPAPDAPPPREVPTRVLEIPKLVLCRSVREFGHYEPLPDAPLLPRHLPLIVAYAEIANPHPQPRDDERYVYYMTQSMKLYRTDVGPSEPLLDTTVSLVVGGASPRRDFHSEQPLHTARPVFAGEHTLVVRVFDQVSGQTATREITFEIEDGR
jgi:hypothetical protein